MYRVANKFSDTLNELFVVNCLISKIFCEHTRRKIVSYPHYLIILIKSTKQLSYPKLQTLKECELKISFFFRIFFLLSQKLHILDNLTSKCCYHWFFSYYKNVGIWVEILFDTIALWWKKISMADTLGWVSKKFDIIDVMIYNSKTC